MTKPVSQAAEKDLPFCAQNNSSFFTETAALVLRSGMLCPRCGHARLEYDGLLNLSCPACGYTGGGGSCT